MSDITVASRAHRILKKLDAYQSTDLPVADLELEDEEKMIGYYQDTIGQPVAVTSYGLHVQIGGKWSLIRFHQMDSAEMPIAKTEIEGFNVRLTSGERVWLPVSGAVGDRFYDAFEFIRFINRVIEDLKK